MAARSAHLLQQLRRLAGPPADSAVSDAVLLTRFVKAHDEDAFAALVRRYGSLVLSAAIKRP
jgi:hypothetical protein